jgi:GNAT superfamily N-acetyltransferase
MDAAELVEDLMAYIPLPPSASRVWLSEACVNFQPGRIQAFANVSALRATPQSLPRLSERAAQIFAGHGRSDFLWFLGPRSTPADAVDRLMSLGATVLGDCTAMLLGHEPPPVPHVDIRPVTTPDDLLTYRQLATATEVAGRADGDHDAHLRQTNETAWRDYSGAAGRRINFLAYLDGVAASAGGLLLTDHGVAVLSGAATLPAARGQGLYRALVHARWVAAEKLGVGKLAVQASSMSSPVLAQLGFERVADMILLQQPING